MLRDEAVAVKTQLAGGDPLPIGASAGGVITLPVFAVGGTVTEYRESGQIEARARQRGVMTPKSRDRLSLVGSSLSHSVPADQPPAAFDRRPAGGQPEGGDPGQTPRPDLRGVRSDWQAWLESPPGRYVLDWEQAQFDESVGDVFGFHALQLGESAIDALRNNRIANRVGVLLADDPLPADRSPLLRVSHFEELPFESQSIDLVVLPHVLEFAQDPHQVLREVDRVLRPEGRMIVCGFNPASLWGLRQLAPPSVLAPFMPRAGHLIGLPRLRDWCKLLGFELERTRYGGFRPPCRTSAWLDRTEFMERAGDRWWPVCGAMYMLCAVKRVKAMRMVGRTWRRPARAGATVLPLARRRGTMDQRGR